MKERDNEFDDVELDDIDNLDDLDDLDFDDLDDIEDLEKIDLEKPEEEEKIETHDEENHDDLEKHEDEYEDLDEIEELDKVEDKDEDEETSRDEDLEEEKEESDEDTEETEEESESEKEEPEDDEEIEVVSKESSKKKSSKDEYEDDDEEPEKKKKSPFMMILLLLVIAVVIILLLLKGCNGKDYIVSFDTRGGNEIADLKVKADGTVERPADPTKEGYIFAGWYLDGEDEEFDFDTKVNSNLKLVAHWVARGEAEVTGVELDRTEVVMATGDTLKLVATLLPSDAKETKLVWSSSDPKVVTVDSEGNITAVAPGSVTVTVMTEDGKFKATCTVVVQATVIADTGVTITGAKTVVETQTITLKATVQPTNATNKTVTWKSSDTKIATVNNKGVVKGIKAGTVTITVTTASGKTATYTVTVTPEVKAESVKITGGTTVQEGKPLTLKATVSPNNTTNKNVTWSVKNGTGSATIDKNGKLTAKKAGTVTVTVTTANGKTASVEITITPKPVVYTYVLTLTPNRMANGNFVSYSVAVTRNGQAFSEFKKIDFGNGISPKTTNVASSAVTADTNGKTYTITLTDGSTAKITVKVAN